MTTSREPNVQAIAVEGSFDDAQSLLKAMFADARFRDAVSLTAVNSINWGRIVAQAVYYVTAAVALGAPHRPVSFTVPTGNFGNVFAAWVAGRMGLPIERLVVATNVNDILDRTFRTGRYEVRGVEPTSSPSMDIQVSSNFERLLFEAGGRDAASVRRAMGGLRQSGAFALDDATRAALLPLFASGRADEAETSAIIRRLAHDNATIIDPHTAVGVAVAERNLLKRVPMITLATAHPAKFPDAVEAACGTRPDLPDWARGILSAPEHYDTLPADLAAIEAAIEARSRAAKVGR
jgi:threonine synthase